MKKCVLCIMAILLLASCGDDETNNGNDGANAGLVGTWMADLSEDGVTYFEEMTLKSDGTFQVISRINWSDSREIEENGYTSGVIIIAGKYRASDNSLMMNVLTQRYNVDDSGWEEESFHEGDYTLSYKYVVDRNRLTLIREDGGSGVYTRKRN